VTNKFQLDGIAARKIVLAVHPLATSTYVGPYSAMIYDVSTGVALGAAESNEAPDSVELAWANSAQKLSTKRETDENRNRN